jgi:MoxR-like ATPase
MRGAASAHWARWARQGEDARVGLHGGDPQIATLKRLVRDTLNGHGGSIVLDGERGVGKSTLLEHVRATSPGVRVVRMAGAGPER